MADAVPASLRIVKWIFDLVLKFAQKVAILRCVMALMAGRLGKSIFFALNCFIFGWTRKSTLSCMFLYIFIWVRCRCIYNKQNSQWTSPCDLYWIVIVNLNKYLNLSQMYRNDLVINYSENDYSEIVLIIINTFFILLPL